MTWVLFIILEERKIIIMKEKLEKIKVNGFEKIDKVTNISELEEIRKELTGKKSELSDVLKSMSKLSPEERKTTGQRRLNTCPNTATAS